MDSTLLGVIIGAGLTALVGLLKSFVEHRFEMQKEEKQWQRQQAIEEEKLKQEKEKEQQNRFQESRNRLQEAYRNSLHTLWQVMAVGNRETLEPNDADALRIYEEAHKWLLELTIRISGHHKDLLHFEALFRDFVIEPGYESALFLTTEISSLSASDLRVESEMGEGDSISSSDIKNESVEPRDGRFATREVSVQIDGHFHRQQFIEGYELPGDYKFNCDLAEISPSQREKILGVRRNNLANNLANDLLRKSFFLATPEGRMWAMHLNPFKVSQKEIFTAWESDYDRQLAAQAQVKNAQDER